MTKNSINDVTPELLMQQFQGKGLKSIIVFTLVVHAVVLTASSVPYLANKLFGADKASMTKEEQVKAALEEASESIREIAAGYGLSPQDISDKFSGGASRAAAAAAGTEPGTTDAVVPEAGVPDVAAPAMPERPISAIEKELDVKADGPAVPKIDDDIF